MNNVLLINPKFPPLHQNYDHVISMLGARFIAPPLALLTVARLVPPNCRLRLVDMNVEPLTDRHIQWADTALVTGIGAQAGSMLDVARRCKAVSNPPRLILGGLHVSVYPDKFRALADAIVSGEAEDAIPSLFADIESGRLRPLYNEKPARADLKQSPAPMVELVDPADYLIWTLQYSRGCPHNCLFCELPRFYGHAIREKDADQFLLELDAVYRIGFRGPIMLGDDNFHRAPHGRDLLAALTSWQRARRYPFMFFTQTDIGIAREPDMMRRMVEAGFTSLQIGIESPSSDALRAMDKTPNAGIDLVAAVRAIHEHGLEVQPAMLIGADGDPENIADLQFDFLRKAGTPRCMISLLRIYRGSRLAQAMKAEGRLLDEEPSGNQTGDFSLNYRTRIGNERVLRDTVRLLRRLYEPRHYFARCWTCVRTVRRAPHQNHTLSARSLRRFLSYMRRSGFCRYNAHFLLFLLKTWLVCPRKTAMGAALGILGYHYRAMSEQARETPARETS